MKTIIRYNSYNDGPNSRMNIHFSDGSQFSRRISAYDAIRIAKEGMECLDEMMEKYATPDPKPSKVELTPEEERFWALHNMNKLGILDEEQKNEYNRLLSSSDL